MATAGEAEVGIEEAEGEIGVAEGETPQGGIRDWGVEVKVREDKDREEEEAQAGETEAAWGEARGEGQ